MLWQIYNHHMSQGYKAVVANVLAENCLLAFIWGRFFLHQLVANLVCVL